ncbi:hypothetical protein [Calothrix sp. PCC 6303]|uniref:hypothetical protein n=1 Tax=Calothrix sp. PCC 6303 TaxID=1170562 RepID=UPI0002A04DAA|nr:hypothetical protein [Calothrix sp. PCC 6303]AFZ03099.1 hypothetical protein Cal6303_4188 [Calothrix sp. PCC 6303]
MTQKLNSNHSGSEAEAIAYKKRLNSWAIAKLIPGMQREIVARFRSRSDADGHMQLLSRMTPDASFMLVFDCQSEQAA